jgi:hypothetical protein
VRIRSVGRARDQLLLLKNRTSRSRKKTKSNDTPTKIQTRNKDAEKIEDDSYELVEKIREKTISD